MKNLKKVTNSKGPKNMWVPKVKVVFFMQVCLKSHHQKEMKWYLDSGCSRHMTGNRSWFRNLRPKDGGVVKFADGIKSKITGIGNVGKNNSELITDVMLVEGLAHNLLSISQFYDQGYKVVFEPS